MFRNSLENIFTQNYQIIIENVLGVTVSVKYFNASRTDGRTHTFASSKPKFKSILRMENKEQMHHKYKICEILNCDMTKVLEHERKTSKLV